MTERIGRGRALVGMLLVAAVAACTPAKPAQPVSAPPEGGGAGSQPAGSTKTLVLMTRAEPDSLAGPTMVPGTTSTGSRRRLFNAGLALRDGDSRPLPYLAEDRKSVV